MFYKTTFEDYWKNEDDGGGARVLTRAPPPLDVFENFCLQALPSWKRGEVVLAVTVTIHKSLKTNGRLVWDLSSSKQYRALHELIYKALLKYEKKFRPKLKAYFFFEFTKSGKVHAHGIVMHTDNKLFYPSCLSDMKHAFQKVGFRIAGLQVEHIKHFKEWSTYIKKDHGKHDHTPLYMVV